MRWTVLIAFAIAAGVVFAIFAVKALRGLGRLATGAATKERKAALKDTVSGAALYALLYFFWAVAAGISMQGLIGFAEDNMGLEGPWPYLIFFALDGAAAFCMVLVTKRAARAASTFTPRLAVWGLVALSSWFNLTHAPDHAGAKVAWACIPIIAGVLFELAQAETRNQAANPERRISAIQWLHPIERTRVLLELAADTQITADEATVRVRDASAAVWLYRLRSAWRPTAGLVRWRTRISLGRADFSNPVRAEEILRRAQIFAQTEVFAKLDYRTPVSARLALGNLIGSAEPASVGPRTLLSATAEVITSGSGNDSPDGATSIIAAASPVPLTALPARPSGGLALGSSVYRQKVTETVRETTDDEPDSDHDDDRKKPTDQDNRKAVTSAKRIIRNGRIPTQKEIADRGPFSLGWARNRIAEAKDDLITEGWQFAPDGSPIPPVEIRSVNGSPAHS